MILPSCYRFGIEIPPCGTKTHDRRVRDNLRGLNLPIEGVVDPHGCGSGV